MSFGRRILCTAVLALLLLPGCSTLSGGGPSVRETEASLAVEIVPVTPAVANDEAAVRERVATSSVDQALASLRAEKTQPAFVFGTGDTMTITLWSFTPRPGIASGPAPIPLGKVTVDIDGAVLLPYVGQAKLAGLTLEQAQAELSSRYASLGLFQKPSVSIDVASVPQGRVLVTGSLGAPKAIPWPPEGLTLADALTQSLGNGAMLLAQSDATPGDNIPLSVKVLRDGGDRAELPLPVALEQDIALRPGDRLVVMKAAPLRVTVLGPGVHGNGVYNFGHTPTLSEVLARGSGLDANAADDHAVFVLRERANAKPLLYDFAWSKPQGLVASHRFAMADGDLVYVAEAPIVSVQRVVNVLFQVALPAQVLK